MTITTAEKSLPLWLERIGVEAYTVSEAERYTGLRRAEISEWFRRSGPNLPHRPRGMLLSYLELIEVAFVASFRSVGIPIKLIRSGSNHLALELKSVHPSVAELVHGHPFVAHYFKEVGFGAFEELFSLAPSSMIRTRVPGNTAWPSALESKFAELDYDHDYGIAVRWYLASKESRVAIDPRIAFSNPMVSGLPTWVIKGRCEAGYTIQEISREYEIDEVATRDALAFEYSFAAQKPRTAP